MMQKIFTSLILIFSCTTFSQTYNDFASEIFFGRLPSARVEAMGRILSLNLDPFFVSQSNPANLTNLKGVATYYSHSSPYYFLTSATYDYFGSSYNSGEFGAFALNFILFNYNQNIFGFLAPEEKRYLYTLTYAYSFKDLFSIGLSTNLFIADYGTDKSYSDTFFELGLSRDFIAVQNSEIKDNVTTGIQIKNIFNQSFTAIDEAQSDAFPSILRLGVANTIEYTDNEIFEKAFLVGFTLGLEYQDLLNSNKLTSYKIGAELSILDVICLRSGYYSEKKYFSDGNLEDFTYGIGFKLSFDKYIAPGFPLELLFDFVTLKQPTYSTNFDDWDNFKTFSVIINYKMQ